MRCHCQVLVLAAGALAVAGAGCPWLAERDPAAAAYVLVAEDCMDRYADAADEARECIRAARARLAPDGGEP